MSKFFVSIFIILSICLLLSGVQWFIFLNFPLISPTKSSIKFTFSSGMSVESLAKKLRAEGALSNPRMFVWLVRLKEDSHGLQAGEYSIEAGKTTSMQLLYKLSKGRVILYSFTIVPGWTFNQLMKALESDPHIVHSLQNLNDAKIMNVIGYKGENPEGRFYPDTYKFPNDFKDTKLLKKAYILMQKVLRKMWHKRDMKVPYRNSYQALIVASIIEKEASLSKERLLISGVIVKRLKKRMHLQLDPTVIYGLGKHFDGNLTLRDLRRKTSYNTYVHYGLPPTPICMPSKDAIYAALHPIVNNMLYYVSRRDGSHVFSATLKEQNLAVKRYQLNRKIKK